MSILLNLLIACDYHYAYSKVKRVGNTNITLDLTYGME